MIASAHEVYVLDEAAIEAAMATTSPDPFSAYFGNEYQFFFWGLVSFVAVSTILAASAFRLFEPTIGPLLMRLKRYARFIVRLTAGATLLTFGYYGVLYGPELPLPEIFGAWTPTVQTLLICLGIALILGAYTRIAALVALGVYIAASLVLGAYVLTYASHFGAYLLLLILGGGEWSLAALWRFARSPEWLRVKSRQLRALAFPIMRVAFGVGIMYAAVYAKYIHSELALAVVAKYGLTDYFPFDPLFIVLGALIVEFLAGLMIVLGVEIRWTALFLVFWLTMGHLFMHEEWWVHLVLYGLGLAIVCHGYDRYSLEGKYLKRKEWEPVL